jgi:hypothetical protein
MKHLHVDVLPDGTVVVSGTARSWWVKDAVVETVGLTAGVRLVEDQVQIADGN